MKTLTFILIAFITVSSFSQRRSSIDIADSNWVVVKFQDFSKDGSRSSGVKFINAETGKITKVEFDDDTNIIALEHVKLDSLHIDEVVIITTKTEKKNSTLNFESKISTFSHDGKLLNSVSLDQLVNEFVINKKSGKIILISSSNRMKSSLKNDEQVETIYDLKTLKRI
jgi:hypothetical protein